MPPVPPAADPAASNAATAPAVAAVRIIGTDMLDVVHSGVRNRLGVRRLGGVGRP